MQVKPQLCSHEGRLQVWAQTLSDWKCSCSCSLITTSADLGTFHYHSSDCVCVLLFVCVGFYGSAQRTQFPLMCMYSLWFTKPSFMTSALKPLQMPRLWETSRFWFMKLPHRAYTTANTWRRPLMKFPRDVVVSSHNSGWTRWRKYPFLQYFSQLLRRKFKINSKTLTK